MVLKVGTKTLNEFLNLEDLLKNNCDLETWEHAYSTNWKNKEIKTVYKHDRYVYTGQREMGILDPSDENVDIIGSEDATTCHIIIIKEHVTSTWGIIHIDTSHHNQLEKLVSALVDNIKVEPDNTSLHFDVYIVGGYDDEKHTSSDITKSVIEYLISETNYIFNLKLACSGFLNTRNVEIAGRPLPPYPAPIHYGAAVNAKTGLVYPARFISHAPDKDIRMLKSDVSLVYSSKIGKVCIKAFDYECYGSAKLWVQANDELILHNLSTSPKVEPSHFCDDMRNMFKRMVSDPDPLETIFKNNQDRIYSLNHETCEWELENPHLFEDGKTKVVKAENSFTVQDFRRTTKKYLG